MQDFTNHNIDLSQLPKYETVDLNQLNNKYWRVILLNIAVFMLFLALVAYLLFTLLKTLKPEPYLFIVGYLLIGVLMVSLYSISFKKRGYAIREKDLIYKSGIISIATSVVPFIRIQHITLNEGIFSRMFQLASLHIYTAGGVSGNIVIPGLDVELARAIKEALSKQLGNPDESEKSRNQNTPDKLQSNRDTNELFNDNDGN